MSFKQFNKDNAFAYVSFAFFSVLAFVMITKATSNIQFTNDAPARAEAVNKLWIGDFQGTLKSCDTNGVCTSHGQIGTQILGMGYFGGLS